MAIADEDFNGIDGAPGGWLDVADGVGRVMGDRALYTRMLRRFRDDYRDGVAPIRGAIASADILLAHRMAHTLKGASGMISAPALHRQASALELVLRSAAAGQRVALAPLDAALAAVLQVIERLLAGMPAQGGAAQAAPRSMQPERAQVTQLAELLSSGDGAALDLLEQCGASLREALGEAGFCEVALATNEFDFEGALEALGRLEQAGREAAGDRLA